MRKRLYTPGAEAGLRFPVASCRLPVRESYMASIRLALTFLALGLLGCATGYLTDKGPGSVTDRDGNLYPVRVMNDGRSWLMKNLSVNIPGSYCYGDSIENCDQYGRLYIWASAAEGCKTLGAGWRLPTNLEWEEMAQQYGGIRTDTGQDGKQAYQRLILGGDSGFNILFGGTRDPSGEYRRAKAHGFFWTASDYDSAHAWFYNLGKGGQFINRHLDGEKHRAISVRCIKR